MKITMPYGNGVLMAEVPDRTQTVKSSWTPEKLAPVNDLEAEIKRALSEPLDSKPLPELVKPGSTVAIAFDDPTVLCFAPVRQTAVKLILEQLLKAGVKKKDILFVCASALHRRWTKKEMGAIIGENIVNDNYYRVLSHDAEDKENLVYFGATENGYDVEVNKCVSECDVTVYVNTSTLRGLTGGWKSVCVGLSTFKSIRWHHHPDGLSAKVHDNPMHIILDEMGNFLESKIGKGRIFKIETVLSTPFEVHKVFAGSVSGARQEVVKILLKEAPKQEQKYDVVLYGVPSYSPYAAFATMNPILTLLSTGLGYMGGINEKIGKKGCTTILATPCPDEWDDVHHAPYREVWDRVLSFTKDPYQIQDQFEEEFANRADYLYKYRFCNSFHPTHGLMACYPLRRMKHIGRVMVAAPKEPELIKHAGFIPAPSVEDAIKKAEDIHGKDCAIAYVNYMP